MKAVAFFPSPVGWLLVQPMETQWLDGNGNAMPASPALSEPVRVVADLIEETHAVIDVPPLMGADRRGYVQLQLQAQLPEMPLKATWQSPSSQPWLPRAFSMNAVGVASHALQDALDQAAEQHRPVQGVWPLSYLMAHWAFKKKELTGKDWLFLCLCLPHGLRMVLLRKGVPVFTRLLLERNPEHQATEVALTLKYLSDNRVMDRTVQPGVVLMQPTPLLVQVLPQQGVQVFQTFVSQPVRSVLAEILALATDKTPGQLAPPFVRRYFLAQQARLGLVAAGVLLAMGGGWMAVVQSKVVLTQINQTRQWRAEAGRLTRTAESVQKKIVSSGVNTGLMRLAIDVKQRELQVGVDLPDTLRLLAQLMQDQPQTELVRTELKLVTGACRSAPAAGQVAVNDVQVEWQFVVRPSSDLSPRARQQLLDSFGRAVRAWPAWAVKVDPVQAASGAVIASNLGPSGPPLEWHWCLSPPLKTPVEGAS